MLLLITLSERGGAQVHVLDLVGGLRDQIDFVVGVGTDGFLAESLRSLGISVEVVPALHRQIDPAAELGAIRQLRALIRAADPHLVHTHSTKAGLLGRRAAHKEGRPAIHTAHSWAFSEGVPPKQKLIAIPAELLARRWTRRIIAVSGADRQLALRYRVAPDARIRVVHNGVPDVPERASPRQGHPPVIVAVARMAPPKDHQLLLRALAGVQADFQLRLIGDGPERARVEATIAELGMGDRVTLAGERSDVAAQLASAQLFLLISRQEGFPLVILEAMRAGLPVIASQVGGVSEAVAHGQTGLLVGRDDLAGLQGALQQLLTDSLLRGRMGAAGRAAWEERFTLDRMLEQTRAVYAEIAKEEGWPVSSGMGARS